MYKGFVISVLSSALVALSAMPQSQAALSAYPVIRSGTASALALSGSIPVAAPLATRPQSGRRMKIARQRAAGKPGSGSVASAWLAALQQRSAVSARPAGASLAREALISPAQMEALKSLSRQNQRPEGLRVYFDRKLGTPAFLRMKVPVNVAARAKAINPGESLARSFLRQNRDLLRLADPDSELALVRQFSDAQGNTHFRFQQQVDGIPVWGSQLSLHADGSNNVYLLSGRHRASVKGLNTRPGVTAMQALQVALEHLGVSDHQPVRSDLVVYFAEGDQPHLAWKIRLNTSLDANWMYFVDAHDRRILHRIDMTQHVVTAASGQDALGNTRNFQAWSENAQFYMIDPTFPLADPPYNPVAVNKDKGNVYVLDARNGDGTQLSYSVSNLPNSGWDPVAVSAMANTRIVYDYFKNRFGRDGIDGAQKNFMIAIHFQQNYNNAFWNGTFMVFGDGDGQTFNQLARCLDVTAHEMSHGVIETSAALRYENQSGALNESFADFFGAMVDADDWLMGEDCTASQPGYLRDMSNPAAGLQPQPTRMSEYQNLPNTPDGDNGGVHVNSGIPNRAAYLIAEGLTAEGLGQSIGRADTEQIFYRALTVYLTASSQFIDARRATLQAAEDLYGAGSAQAQAVAAGWDAVEVVEGGATVPQPNQTTPSPTDAVVGDDVMVYLYPLDGTRDFNPNDQYGVFAQVMTQPLAYDSTQDINLGNTLSALPSSRPAPYTDAQGTLVFFVGQDNNIYMLDTGAGSQQQITNSGTVWSLAISQDGRYAAYTTTNATDNSIHVIDIVNSTEAAYTIQPSDYQQNGGSNFNSVQYADSLSFSYDGKTLVFDAFNCLSTQNSTCSSGGGYRYWSIGLMDVVSGRLLYPFPDQTPAVDLSYPVFAKNNNFVVAFDFSDYSSFDSTGQVDSKVLTINFESQAVNTVYDFGLSSNGFFGIPSFWGDDDALTIQVPSATAGTSAARIRLNPDWTAASATLDTVNPFAVAMPLMHRLGQRVLTGSLQVSGNSVNFGDVALQQRVTRSLTLSNPGNADINITQISITGNDAALFSHNATNMLLPRGASVDITLSFNAPQAAGAKVATLNLSSDANSVSVSLMANAVAGNTGGGTGGAGGGSAGGSGGGGGAMSPVLLVLIISLFLMLRLGPWQAGLTIRPVPGTHNPEGNDNERLQ